ncbi:MAG: hypothetical protein AAFY83_02000 [Pseudomonadota bacterium]
MTASIKQRIARLEALDFGPTYTEDIRIGISPLNETPPAGAGATVMPGTTIAFSDDIPADLRGDLEDAILLSSMAADQKATRRYPSREWYTEYQGWLENCGFLIQSTAFQRRSTTKSVFKIADEALDIIGAVTGGTAALSVLQSTLMALSEKADDDGLIALFESETKNAGDGAFQLGQASLSGEGRAVLPFGLFAFRSTSIKKKFLFFSWDKDAVELFASASSAIFTQADYAPLRDQVNSLIANRRKERLSRLTI